MIHQALVCFRPRGFLINVRFLQASLCFCLDHLENGAKRREAMRSEWMRPGRNSWQVPKAKGREQNAFEMLKNLSKNKLKDSNSHCGTAVPIPLASSAWFEYIFTNVEVQWKPNHTNYPENALLEFKPQYNEKSSFIYLGKQLKRHLNCR